MSAQQRAKGTKLHASPSSRHKKKKVVVTWDKSAKSRRDRRIMRKWRRLEIEKRAIALGLVSPVQEEENE